MAGEGSEDEYTDGLIAVLDVGKTNVKLVAHDRTGRRVHARSTPNAPLTGPPYDRVDVEGIWTFLLDGLREIAGEGPVSDIIATTHGCAFACLDRAALDRAALDRAALDRAALAAPGPGDGLALPVMDYEWEGVRALDDAYDALRPPFAETGSPALPVGLNAGRQLHYLMGAHADAFARVGAILPLPQYLAWRLSGGLAADPSSLGCHSDLWEPARGRHSSLARRFGWDRLLGPVRGAHEVVGTLRPALARACGLDPDTRVRVGVHDSNASLAPHLDTADRFSLISSGTWAIAFAVGADPASLDETRDCLLNVDMRGRSVPSARFMAGRERTILLDGDGAVDPPPGALPALVAEVLDRDGVPTPSFVTGSGPFPHRTGTLPDGWSDLSPARRSVAASLHVGRTLVAMLDLVSASGPVLIEGPLAADPVVAAMLDRASSGDVRTVDIDAAGGAAWLVHRRVPPSHPARAIEGLPGAVARVPRLRADGSPTARPTQWRGIANARDRP